MQNCMIRKAAKAALAAASLVLLQACSPTLPSNGDVAGAYETSGLVVTQPYTRSIFSSSNF